MNFKKSTDYLKLNKVLIFNTREILKTYEYILKSLENYPHKYIELKQHIDSTILDMIEAYYMANNGYEKEKNKKEQS